MTTCPVIARICGSHVDRVLFVFVQALHVPIQPTLRWDKESQTKRQHVHIDILSGGTYSAIFKRTLHAKNRFKHVDALEQH